MEFPYVRKSHGNTMETPKMKHTEVPVEKTDSSHTVQVVRWRGGTIRLNIF